MQIAAVGTQRLQRSVNQVNGRSTCCDIEQRRITIGCRLYHFVLNREQVRRILTGLAIRADDDALELVYGLRVIHCKMERILRQVVGVMHHMSGIVTLEHQHQLEVITEVILTQPQSRRQFLLVDTAGYTSDETYLRPVIQPNAVQRFD